MPFLFLLYSDKTTENIFEDSFDIKRNVAENCKYCKHIVYLLPYYNIIIS